MRQIPTPQELGLPPKFQHYRTNQEEAILSLVNETKRGTALCRPTGSGKTVDYVSYALITKEPTCIVTQNRGLQNQLMDEFKSIGMVDIRGRKNYVCPIKEDFNCELGYASRCPYKGTFRCESSAAEMRASTSRLVVTNYDKWISARRYGLGMQHFTTVVFDEAHHAPMALAKAMQVTLHHREIGEALGLDFLSSPESDSMANWKDWASMARSAADIAMHEAKARITGVHDAKPAHVRHYTHMRNLVRRLAILSTCRASNWVCDETKEGWVFDPIHPGQYAEAALLLRIPRIIAVSATIRPKSMHMIGMGNDSFTFREFDSDFDPRRGPFYWVPTQRAGHKQADMSAMWNLHDTIAGQRRDRKSITHTISFARRDEILTASRWADSMIVNTKGEPPTEMIDEFRAADPGTIFVTPSVGTGYDFPMKDCEFQFVAKIPFLDRRSKIVQARNDSDPEYEPYTVSQTLQQIAGRGLRRKEDQCETFIGDDHMKWFRYKLERFASRSFLKRCKMVETIPPPPQRLP